MPYTDEGKALMLWHLRNGISHVSLHSVSSNGYRELPFDVYQRKEIDLRDPVDGEMKSRKPISFDIPAGAEVDAVGFWSGSSSGDVLLAIERVPKQKYNGRGVYVIDLATFDLNLDLEASR